MEEDQHNEIKELLEKNLELSRKNNEILKKVKVSMRNASIWKIFKLVFFVALALGLFFFLQPYIQNIIDSYNGLIDQVQTIKGVVDSPLDSVKSIFNR